MELFDFQLKRPGDVALAFVIARWPAAEGDAGGLDFEPLAGDGSERRFVRVSKGSRTAILVYGPDAAENISYEMIGRHLWGINRSTPEFLAVDQELHLFLTEDLGPTSLQDMVHNTDDVIVLTLYEKVVGLLADIHDRGLMDFDRDWCYQTPRYDRKLILRRETGYFLEAFVQGYLRIEPDAPALAPEFGMLADAALSGAETVLMLRDFQSRNIMIKGGRPRVIDFQGARPGPPGYDLASLLYDPYVDLSPDLRTRLLDFYADRRSGFGHFHVRDFKKNYAPLAVCRLLQALGAYGFLTRVKMKKHFETYIIPAVASLEILLAGEEFSGLPRLKELIGEVKSRLEDRRES